MEVFKRQTHIDFIGNRRISMGLSVLLNILTLVSLFVFGLNFGLDFWCKRNWGTATLSP